MNLYTKYRSKNFSEVVGQYHVVKVLTNAIVHERVAHAYLFSGPRGTGKTTLARLLAKSLNCENRKSKEFESCNECRSCREILAGSSMDIIEIDAASNRGIDEIRELREKAKFAPSGKKHKIFIIDEVHMLTREAFNALLKILEEPPKHVVFILATTELHKVPETIISRTQQFDFKLHNLIDIIKQLTKIAHEEKIKIDQESIELIAQSAHGGLRDAISLLDQVANTGEKIDQQMTRELLGLTSHELLMNFVTCLIENDIKGLLDIINKIDEIGADFYQFVYEILEILRKMLLFVCGYEKILDAFTDKEKEKIIAICKKTDKNKIIFYIDNLLKTQAEIKNASIPQLPLEIVIFKLVEDIQEDIIEGENEPVQTQTIVTEKIDITVNKIPEKEKTKKESKKILSVKTRKNNTNFKYDEFKEKWPEILKNFKGSGLLNSLLKEAKPTRFEGDVLYIAVPFSFHKDKLEDKKVFAEVNQLFDEYLTDTMMIKFIVDEALVKEMPKHDANNFGTNDALSMDASEIFG